MAKSDLAATRRVLIDAEHEMDALFGQLAHDIGDLVLRASGPDGKIPIQALPMLQREAERLVRQRFLDASGRGFDETGQPLAPYPRIIAEGQRVMIRLALERTAKILDAALPEDLKRAMAARPMVR